MIAIFGAIGEGGKRQIDINNNKRIVADWSVVGDGDGHADRQADRQTGRQTDRQTDRHPWGVERDEWVSIYNSGMVSFFQVLRVVWVGHLAALVDLVVINEE